MQKEIKKTLDDLQCEGYKIYQPRSGHRFGEDSVLLANYAADYYRDKNKRIKIFDLGSGSGILSFLLAAKLPEALVSALEIDEDAAKLFEENILLNGQKDRMKIYCGDWKDISNFASKGSFDMVICNPPYYPRESGYAAKDEGKHLPRLLGDEDEESLYKSVAYLLKDKGLLFMVSRTFRLPQILSHLKDNQLQPVGMQFIYPDAKSQSKTFLLRARYKGRDGGLIIEEPFIKNS